MARDRDLSPYKRRYSRSPSPAGHRHSWRSRRDRSRSPYSCRRRRRSPSVSLRRQKCRSPTPKRRKTRSPTPWRYKRQRSRSASLSPGKKSRSPSNGSIEGKNAISKPRRDDEERQRNQLETSTGGRNETGRRRNRRKSRSGNNEKIRRELELREIKLEIHRQLEDGRKKLHGEVAAHLEKEKENALVEAKRREEQAWKEKQELGRMLEENRRKVEEAQRQEALEQQRREEERYRELEELQRQKEEAMRLRRNKMEEEGERANQMKLLGKNKSRPKLSFALALK